MSLSTHILALPREIRDAIYKEYFPCEGGYHFNYRTGKLRLAEGQPIDLSLTSTCAQIAAETRGLALQANTIHFSTWYSNETRPTTARLDFVLSKLEQWKMIVLSEAYRSGGISNEITERICSQFPDFQELLSPQSVDDFPLTLYRLGKDHARSLRRLFATATLDLLRHDTQFQASMGWHPEVEVTEIAQSRRFWEAAITPNDNNRPPLDIAPWIIPSNKALASLIETCSMFPRFLGINENVKYRFSAAALAVRFLESIVPATRRYIRKVILNEKEIAVGNPECRAQGLIPFCQENPGLSVERKVDLWRNIFAKATQVSKTFARAEKPSRHGILLLP